jgi:hypothetical protein
LVVILLAATTIANAFAQTTQSQTNGSSATTLTNKDVLDLVKAEMPSEVIVAKIQSSPCDFDTSPGALKSLKAAGVPGPVILAMVKASAPAPEPAPAPAPAKAETGSSGHGKSLWISKFVCPTDASDVTATVQNDDLAALQQSSLFDRVLSFANNPAQPAGAWVLSARVTDYANGNTAERVLLGFGTGRAHIVVAYELHDPGGAVVWSQSIKTQPPYFSSAGGMGGVQNQHQAENEQPRKLLAALSKYFGGGM